MVNRGDVFGKWVARLPRHAALSSSGNAGDPVRRDRSAQALLPLEYWVARSRLRQGYAGLLAHSADEALAKAPSRARRLWAQRHTSAFSRHDSVRAVQIHCPSASRGRRESRALAAPAAWGATKTSPPVSPPRVQPVIPAFPAQWFDGFLRALPGERRFLSPLSHQHRPARLDATVAAPGPHDFAVRGKRFVRRKTPDARNVHCIPAQRIATTMITSLWRAGVSGPVPVICPTGQGNILIIGSQLREDGNVTRGACSGRRLRS